MSNNRGIRTLNSIFKENIISKPLLELLYKKPLLVKRDAEFLFSIALTLIDEHEKDTTRNKALLIEFAYYIIAKTCFKISKFQALYDFSVNYGYYPVARKITDLELIKIISINHILSEVSIDDFSDEDKVKTYEQDQIFRKVLNDESLATSFLAPTSYGKSELIFEHIDRNKTLDKIAIIVPTKALIDQVSREARNKIRDRKIIMHDQSYESRDKRILAIVTQERALRLLEQGIVFHVLYIDEAHELLDFDFKKKFNNRSLLLARLIQLSHFKNPELKTLYLSPVLRSANNLHISNLSPIGEHKIAKDLKLLDISFVDKTNQVFKYDRYLDAMIETHKVTDSFDFISKTSKYKNLHFLYRPIFVENYAEKLFSNLPTISIDEPVIELIEELKNIVHPQFKLIRYLEKGILYIHAKIPSIIKNYLLKQAREQAFIQHIVANSVILAGINFPIDNLFYISGYSNLREINNLVGRVNRLNEIFHKDNDDLSRIFIPVNFIEIEGFEQPNKGILKNKVKSLRDNFKDDIKNPVLENAKIHPNNKSKANEIKEDEILALTTFDNPDFKTKLKLTGAGALLNYTGQGLRKLEQKLNDTNAIIDIEIVLDTVSRLFFQDFVTKDDFNPEHNAKRLVHKQTIDYYKIFLSNLKQFDYKERVERTVDYWKKHAAQTPLVYIGGSFGEVPQKTENYPDSQNKVYVNIEKYLNDDTHLHNLAILKLQVDEDFLSHEISVLVNALLKFEIITQNQYDQFIYGSTATKDLKLLKAGISRSTFNKLRDADQLKHIETDEYGNFRANDTFSEYIASQKGIYKFELEQYFS